MLDGVDNCPLTANPDQADNDSDGAGDVCDADDDNDGVPDVTDNCPLTPNSDQADNDGDNVGDVCDADDDNDGVLDGVDNCPLTPNPDQADLDSDAIGDVCDADRDGDGVNNDADVFPDDPAEWADDDVDGVGDNADNCAAYNPDQADWDDDGQGDACDPVVTLVSSAPDPVAISAQPVMAYGEFSDADDDDSHTAVWDWGDSSTSAGTVDQSGNSVSASHEYAAPGVYAVTLTVSDAYPAADSDTYQFVRDL